MGNINKYIGINIVRKNNDISLLLFDDYNKGISKTDNLDKEDVTNLLDTINIAVNKIKSDYNIK